MGPQPTLALEGLESGEPLIVFALLMRVPNFAASLASDGKRAWREVRSPESGDLNGMLEGMSPGIEDSVQRLPCVTGGHPVPFVRFKPQANTRKRPCKRHRERFAEIFVGTSVLREVLLIDMTLETGKILQMFF